MSREVYVLETGEYAERAVRGVYATLEAAQAAHGPEQSEFDCGGDTYTWLKNGPGEWEFDACWEHAATVTEWRVSEASAPVRALPEGGSGVEA